MAVSDIGGGGHWTVLLDQHACSSFHFIDAAFTDVAGDLLATLPTYAAGDLLLAGWRTTSTGAAPSGWSSQLAGQTNGAAVSGFHVSYRIADGSEGTTLTLPTGSDGDVAVVACWRMTADISGSTWLTEIDILGAPFYGGGYLSGEHVDSVASETAAAWPNSGQFAADTLLNPNYEIDTFSIAFLADTLPAYHWNHEFERAQSASIDGWTAIVADGLGDSSSGSPPPSIELEATHTGIYHGWLTFICAGAAPPTPPLDCDVDDYGDLINDDFADALALSVFIDSSFSFSGGFSGSHSPIDGETTVGATKEIGEPDHSGNTGGHSIWFSYTPFDTGVATIEVDGNGTDSVGKKMLLAVYTGASVGALTEITYDVTAPDPEAGFGSANVCDEIEPYTYLQATLTGGTTYYIAVDVADGETVNAIRLSGNLVP